MLQVSFFRSNLTFGVINKRRCMSKDGKTHEGHALIDYIRWLLVQPRAVL